jgi:hypothetical protein
MRELSRRALREPVPNLLYVRAAAERLPAELAGTADRLTVVLPWGSLLRAVAGPDPAVLANVRSLCRPEARLTVVLGSDPVRDRAELLRLGLASLEPGALAGRLGPPYRENGFRLRYLRPVDGARLASWPTRWATRLARGPARRFIELEAVAADG